jgi:hypothetical protein
MTRFTTLTPSYGKGKLEMTWLLSLLSKLAWWLYPKLSVYVVDAVSTALAEVEAVDAFHWFDSAKRARALDNLVAQYGMIPEPVVRFLTEFALVLFRLGITNSHLHEMEVIASGLELKALGSTEKRQAVLDGFSKIFPDVPERLGRLLLELVVAKINGVGIAPALVSGSSSEPGK